MFRFWPHFLLLLVIAANAFALRHEVSSARVDLNDNVLHYTLIEHTVQAIEHRRNPLDFWVPEWGFGYPVFRTYQPLGHLFVALIYFLLGKTVSLLTLFVWIRYLLLVLLPLSFFICARLLYLPPPTAVAAALLAPLIATNGLYGLEAESFVWAGVGLYTQLFAAHLLLLGIGLSFRAIKTGKNLAMTGVVLGLCFLGHMLYGYIGLITTLVIAAQLRGSDFLPTARRLALIWAAAGSVAAFQLVSLFADRQIVNHSPWEPGWKWDSYGFAGVFQRLFSGEILDHGRLPVLSVLALIGIAAFFWYVTRQNREDAAAPIESWTFLASGALVWTLLYCGRPLWGPALLLLGITSDFQLHRFSGVVQIFLILLGGIGLAQLWNWIGPKRVIWSALAMVIILNPAVRERSQTFATQATWGQQNLDAFAYAEPTLEVSIRTAKQRNGRVYAGLANNWGGQWKVASVPFYAFLGPREVPAVSFLYHAMSLAGDFVARFDENKPEHYRLFNVSTLIAEQANLLFIQPIGKVGRFHLWATPSDGYFDVVDVPYSVSVDRDGFFDVNDRWLSGNWLAHNQHLAVALDAPVPSSIPTWTASQPLPDVAVREAPGAIVRQSNDDESYSAELNASRASYLLFKMSWHPNWSVLVDGVKTPSFMLSPGFLGVPLTAGSHKVVCRYEPGIARLIIAALGLAMAAGMVLVERKIAKQG